MPRQARDKTDRFSKQLPRQARDTKPSRSLNQRGCAEIKTFHFSNPSLSSPSSSASSSPAWPFTPLSGSTWVCAPPSGIHVGLSLHFRFDQNICKISVKCFCAHACKNLHQKLVVKIRTHWANKIHASNVARIKHEFSFFQRHHA